MSFSDNLATFGRGYAYVSAVVVTGVAVVAVVIAFYKYNEPDTPPATSGDNARKALILFGISMALVAFSWVWVWLTDTSKFAAEAGGVMAVVPFF